MEQVDGQSRLTKVGITCALCHSTVDNSFAPGIGHRLDGWPNRNLDPGKIIAASPAVPAAAKDVYTNGPEVPLDRNSLTAGAPMTPCKRKALIRLTVKTALTAAP